MGYSSLISYIQSRVYENDSQAISGTGLQEALLQMVASLGDGYQFKGVATPATNPGTPDQNVFYIASEVGTYSNFGLSVGENEVAIFLWNGSWSKQSTGAASVEAVNQLVQELGNLIPLCTKVTGKYLKSDHTTVSSASYDYYTYLVSGEKTICVNTNCGYNNFMPAYALFSTEEISDAGFISQVLWNENDGVYKVNIPDNCKLIVVNVQKNILPVPSIYVSSNLYSGIVGIIRPMASGLQDAESDIAELQGDVASTEQTIATIEQELTVAKYSDPLTLSLISGQLRYDADSNKIVSAPAGHLIYYKQFSEDTVIRVQGNYTEATNRIFMAGVTAVIPANDVAVSNPYTVQTTTAVDTLITVPAGQYLCVYYYYQTFTSPVYRSVSYESRLDNIDTGLNAVDSLYKNRYDDKIVDVEYSAMSAQPNSLHFFQNAYDRGFRAQKADMRLTADNKIVLCHDAGFTFDGNGRITTFDSNNYTPIRNLTYNEVCALEFAIPAEDVYIHPGTLDGFLLFCKQKQVVPYVTFRPEYIADTATAFYNSLLKFKMESIAIVNLYPYSIQVVTELKDKKVDMLLCSTRESTEPLSETLIDAVAEADCTYLCLNGAQEASITNELVLYASSKNIRIWVYATPDPENCMENGVTGFQNFTTTPFV